MSNENFNWRKSTKSNGSGECVEVASTENFNWRKSIKSNGSGNCVEVADTANVIMVRDTTNRDGGTLAFGAAAWERFIRAL